MTKFGVFDAQFFSIKEVGGYVDIKKVDYERQVFMAAHRFNRSKRSQGRKVSVKTMRDGNKVFYRVFLIEHKGFE